MQKRPAITPPEHRTYPRGAPPRAAIPPRPGATRTARWQRAVPPDRSFPRADGRQR
ncbi:MAG TPA: hypothetical protein VHJ39_13765 [Solirubrobacteraceae bacterium]|nr:hypothetical protein [Solirubrobacteraceae bacterium]